MIVDFRTRLGDVEAVKSDVLLLPYPEIPYRIVGYDWKFRVGVGHQIAALLTSASIWPEEELPSSAKDILLVDTHGLIAPSHVILVGTVPLVEMGYEDLYDLPQRALEKLNAAKLHAEYITTTVHRVFGLDAAESAQNLAMGFLQGMREFGGKRSITVTFVERDERILRIITSALRSMGIEVSEEINASETTNDPERDPERDPVSGDQVGVAAALPLKDASDSSPVLDTNSRLQGDDCDRGKPHIFVAMPYAEKFHDVYEFGIYAPVRGCGFICEKVDDASFTGDILQRIKDKIESAKLVIADLTESRPNVYLEVGYAWGQGVPVVFLARDGEPLHFDVKTHKCIHYRTIGRLARDLEKLLRGVV